MEGQTDNKICFPNRLWQLRHERGLGQKQVARLLGHKTCDQLSRFERGKTLPSFENALKLASIYHSSIEEMFTGQLEFYRTQITESIKLYAGSLKSASAEIQAVIEGQEIAPQKADETKKAGEISIDSAEKKRESPRDAQLCFYAALLEAENPTDEEQGQVRKHAARLIRTVAYL